MPIDSTTAREVHFSPSNPTHARRALTVLRLHFEEFGHDTLLEDDLFASDLAQIVANCVELEFEVRHMMTIMGIDPAWFDEQLAYFRRHPVKAAVFVEREPGDAQYHGLRL